MYKEHRRQPHFCSTQCDLRWREARRSPPVWLTVLARLLDSCTRRLRFAAYDAAACALPGRHAREDLPSDACRRL
jgi:hypothetical protein